MSKKWNLIEMIKNALQNIFHRELYIAVFVLEENLNNTAKYPRQSNEVKMSKYHEAALLYNIVGK